MFALVALSGCVDKTPPPLWPTPPPPTLAVPIGARTRDVELAGAAGAGGGAAAVHASPDPAAPGGDLGPWQPEPAR